jgi:hypothetical protein
MVLGPDGLGAGAVMLWGIVVSVIFLIGLRRKVPAVGG